MSPIYKRVQYQKQNGFDVPYWDIDTFPDASPTPSITPSCGILPSEYECLNVSGFTGVNTWANGDYTFLSYGLFNESTTTLDCDCNDTYAIYAHNTKPWIHIGYMLNASAGGYIYSIRHNGFLGSPQAVYCNETYSGSALILNPSPTSVPTQTIGGKVYPLGGSMDAGGYITFVDCISPSPTPSITPTITNTPSITPSITPTNTNTPTPSISVSTTPTNTPTTTMTPTPSTTPPCSTCEQYSISNNDRDLSLQITYTDCDTGNPVGVSVLPDTSIQRCSCDTPVRTGGSTNYVINNQGVCTL